MNQMDLKDAIDGVQHRLRPEVGRIVDTSIANGARQVRRRRRATALAALAAVTAVGVGGGWWLQQPAPVEHLTASDAAPFAAGSNDPAPVGERQRAGVDEIRDGLLAMLSDGEVTEVVVREDPVDTNWAGNQRGVEVTLRLDGTPVRLSLIDFDRDSDKVKAKWSQDPGPKPEDCRVTANPGMATASTAAERECAMWNENNRLRECALASSCADLDQFVAYSPKKEVCNYAAHYPCRELPDGSWLAAGTGGDDPDSDSPFTMATRATGDGWYVYASSENHPAAVLTVDDVTAIVTSDARFE
ncbi:hypothetical protein [Nocardioides sp. B-3]|uniref:hypothetical protein n=1 Tax=Nocardioides sp. B-3 TaxID=2895565 RepID=UPI0021526110|nr:hypothetical protein [Nocardioides sp. B-3]UUZ58567.1 hypothetical protein LP418_20775 [Nocardioides sp. B-3]